MIHLLWSVLVGFIIGLVARALVPGADAMGFLATTAIGILGSILGGFIGGLIKKPAPDAKVHPAGLLMSVVGAIILLLIWKHMR